MICRYSANQTESSEALAAEERTFLRNFTNVSVERDEVCSSMGRLFYVAGSDIAKSRRPIVVLVCGMTRKLIAMLCLRT